MPTPTFTAQVQLSKNAVVVPPTNSEQTDIIRTADMIAHLMKTLDEILPTGRHKSLCMTALEEAMFRARMSIMADGLE